MLKVRSPKISVSELVARARAAALPERPRAVKPAGRPSVLDEAMRRIERALADAERVWRVGTNVPPMSNLPGALRRGAVPVVKTFYRVAQLITRDQRDFNQSMLEAVRELATVTQRLSGMLESQTRELSAVQSQMRDELSEYVEKISASLEASAELNSLLTEGIAGIETRIQFASNSAVEELRRGHADLKRRTIEQERRLSLVLEEARRRLPAPFDAAQLQALAQAADALEAEAMRGFEAEFRGSEEEIQKRLESYLPILQRAGAGGEDRPVLDLGCGRGELLELCRQHKLRARGVERNPLLSGSGRDRGLEVVDGDVLEYLSSLPDKSLGAVVAIHVLEHLPLHVILAVLDQSLRVLKPGGVAVFETPNPENLTVGASTFYMDPTHLRPLHPAAMRFILESRGFVPVELRYLHPREDLGDVARLPEALGRMLTAAQDYAVLGFKPRD